MPKAVSNTLILAGLAVAAAATWYWGRPSAPPEETGAGDSTLSRGYYLQDAVMRRTDDNGEILYEIHAGRIVELPAERLLALRDVRIVQFESAARQWAVLAGEGEASMDERRVELSGGVELKRDSSDGAPAVSLKTERLRLDLENQVASTDAAVTVRHGEALVTAIGMGAFMVEDRLELESNVQVRLQP